MNKHELAVALSARTNVTKKIARLNIDVVLELIAGALSKGEPVLLTGFGRLYLQQRKPRKRRNPLTGGVVEINGDTTVRFKPCKDLHNLLNRR